VSELPALPAGAFSDWLRRTRASWLEQTHAEVACGDCCACCSTSHFVHVGPEEGGARAALPSELLFPAPGQPEGTALLGYDEHGCCPMLTEGRCSVYEHRPLTCRIYDCRVFAAAGLDADRGAITAQARRWEFSYPAAEDRAAHAAVRAAARFLCERAACFPGGEVPDDPARVAVLAVKVSDVFLERVGSPAEAAGWAAGGQAPGACSDADRALARAVIEANERFETARRANARS